jgi:hypothetical protein
MFTQEPKVKGALTWAEFECRLEYLRCRPQQRAWIWAYLETGNPTTATAQTYHCKNQASVVSLSLNVRQSSTIKAALACWFGTSVGMLLEETQAHLRLAVPGSVAASRLLAQKERLIVGEKPPKNTEPDAAESPLVQVDVQPQHRVGDVVTMQDGKRYKVTALDVNGVPTDGDEVDEHGQPIVQDPAE